MYEYFYSVLIYNLLYFAVISFSSRVIIVEKEAPPITKGRL